MKKVFFSAAITFSIQSIVLVLSAQNVGIGTTSPSANLHITPNSSTYAFRIDQGQNGDGILCYVNTTSADKTIFRATSLVSGLIVLGNGNVGIGPVTPTSKLEVVGSVKANAFVYSSPKIFYYSIPAAAFSASTSSDIISKEGGTGGTYFTTGNTMYAPINLPHNATMTQVAIHYTDNAASNDIHVTLLRKAHTGLYDIMGSFTSTGSPGPVAATLPNISQPLVDNANYYYVIQANANNGDWPGSMLVLRSVVVRYTLPEAQ